MTPAGGNSSMHWLQQLCLTTSRTWTVSKSVIRCQHSTGMSMLHEQFEGDCGV